MKNEMIMSQTIPFHKQKTKNKKNDKLTYYSNQTPSKSWSLSAVDGVCKLVRGYYINTAKMIKVFIHRSYMIQRSYTTR